MGGVDLLPWDPWDKAPCPCSHPPGECSGEVEGSLRRPPCPVITPPKCVSVHLSSPWRVLIQANVNSHLDFSCRLSI